MEQDAQENLELRRYLLRELPTEEALRVEARLFLESEYLQQLHATEDELVDEYVYEELSPDERERFEAHFLSDTERYKDLEIARALKKYVPTESAVSPLPADAGGRQVILPPPARRTLRTLIWNWRPAVRLSLAAAIIVIALGGLLLILWAARRQNQSPPVQAQLPVPQGGETTPEPRHEENGTNNQVGDGSPQYAQGPQYVAHHNHEQSANGNEPVSAGNDSRSRRKSEKSSARREKSIFALLLPVGPVRGEGSEKKVVLPAGARVVHLQLALIGEDKGRSYEVTLRADDGRNIKTWTGLRSTRSKSGRVISIKVPAGLLNQRNYSVALRDITFSGEARNISTYHFQVPN